MPTTPFLNMFGRSPIKPLEEHMAKVYGCVKQLDPFFSAVFGGHWTEAEVVQQEIVRLENIADDLKRDIRLHLPKSLFTSVSRDDLLDLLNVQDRIANTTKDIAGIVFGRQMQFPVAIQPAFREFFMHCLQAVNQANIAINELDELMETSFSGCEIKLVDSMIAKLSAIEHETDEQQIQLRRALYNIEAELPAVQVMFLYKIIEWTGELADLAREVGDRLQILLAK